MLCILDKISQDAQKASLSPAVSTASKDEEVKSEPIQADPEVEKQLLVILYDLADESTCNSLEITDKTSKALERDVSVALVENLLEKFDAQQLIRQV